MCLRSIIAPSVLASDMGNLSHECKRVMDEGADWLHMDVMDGSFVQSVCLGAPVLASVFKGVPGIYMDCHMMVAKPEQYVEEIAAAGGKSYTFHYEATKDPLALIKQIKAAGMAASMALSPDTPAEVVSKEIADALDMILIMTVIPGKGGQKFMPECMPKVAKLRELYPTINIQVDGGVGPATVAECAHAGSNVIVAGSAIFGAKSSGEVIKSLRAAVDDAIEKRKSQ